MIFQEENYYAQYDKFNISGEDTDYILHVSGYSGTSGDSLSAHNGQAWTTRDRDNDPTSVNCAQDWHGAWWYGAGWYWGWGCHRVNLNGDWLDTVSARGLSWFDLTAHTSSVTKTEMKIRPVN